MASEWDLGSSSEIIVSLGDFNGYVGKCTESFEGVHKRNGIGKKMRKEENCLNSVIQKSCAWQKHDFIRQSKGKLFMWCMQNKN